ncbi:MAG: ATP-binding protein [bacterium]
MQDSAIKTEPAIQKKLTPRRFKLGARLIIAFVLVVLLSMSVPSVFVMNSLQKRIYNETSQKMKSDLVIASLLLEQKEQSLLRIARTISRDPLVEKMVAFRLGNPLAARISSFLEGVPQDEVTSVTVVDRDGIVLYRSQLPLSPGDSILDDPFISLAIRGKEIAAYESQPVNKLEKEMALTSVNPTDKTGTALLLKAAVPVIVREKTVLVPSFKPAPAPIPGEVSGTVCVSYLFSTNASLLDDIKNRTKGAASIYVENDLINTTEKNWLTLPLETLLEGRELPLKGVYRYPRQGEIGGYFPLLDIIGNPVAVFELRNSTLPLQKGFRNEILKIIFFVITGLAISVLLAYITTQRITNPIMRLRQGAEEMGKGNLLYQIEVPAGDEIAELADSFNEMGSRLHNSIRQMQISKQQIEEYSSRLKEAHKNLERYSQQLEKVNQQLLESNVNLQKANEVKNTFLSTVSHELKTPLTTIMGYVSMMLHGSFGSLSDDMRISLEVVLRRARNLQQLISDLLSLSQIEAGKIEIRKQYIDLTKELRSIEEVFADRLKEKNLTLSVLIRHRLPRVNADGDRINQVLFNLVGNAVKFTSPGGKITVSAAHQLESNSVLFTVADTGIGIPKLELEHIFKPFYQVDQRDGREFGGTGLGLSIAKNIVELHGGTIWVESREFRGTTFYFTIPVS